MRLVDVLAASSQLPQQVRPGPDHNLLGLAHMSLAGLRPKLLDLVVPFCNDPVARTYFWQHAMPLVPHWFAEFLSVEQHQLIIKQA